MTVFTNPGGQEHRWVAERFVAGADTATESEYSVDPPITLRRARSVGFQIPVGGGVWVEVLLWFWGARYLIGDDYHDYGGRQVSLSYLWGADDEGPMWLHLDFG